MTRCFTSYYLYIDSPLSVSKVWKNESKVILSLKFQNLSLIGNLKKKKSVLLLQVPEHLSFRLFLNEKEWGGGQLPFTESQLRVKFFCLCNFCIHAEVILFSTSIIPPPKTSVIPLTPAHVPVLFHFLKHPFLSADGLFLIYF